MRYALYCRVSTQDQTNLNQKLILENHAKRQGWDYEVFEEQESTRNTRPVKYNLLQRLRNKEFGGVCVLKLDRWARSSQELILEISELYNKKVLFISLNDNIDLSTPSGKLQFQILSSFAEFERSLISQRTKDGLARAKSQGKQLGRPEGAKDKGRRKKGGYYIREAKKKQREDQEKGLHRDIEHYLNNCPPKK